MYSGILEQAGLGGSGAMAANVSSPSGLGKDLSVLPPITVSAAQFDTFRAGPQPVRNAGAANSIGQLTGGQADSTIADAQGFLLYSFKNPADGFTWPRPLYMQAASGQSDKLAAVYVHSILIRLRYQTPSDGYKTYATLGGCEALPVDTGIDGLRHDDFATRVIKSSGLAHRLSKHYDTNPDINAGRTLRSPSLIVFDPRGNRFGPGRFQYMRHVAEKPQFTCISDNGMVGPYLFYPDIVLHNSATPTRPELGTQVNGWAGNLPHAPLFKDSDDKWRKPDAGLGFVAPGRDTTDARIVNPYYSANLTNEDAACRPVILQRPYRSVAELGYVYRDVPWQTLNFWNADSGDAALLDLFSVMDEPPLTAARASLHSRHSAVHQALLNQVAQAFDGTQLLDNAKAKSIAEGLENYMFTDNGEPKDNFPLNVADLTSFMSSGELGGANLDKIKWHREVVVRALSAGQTRTWNVLMDVVAQAGRFTVNGTGAGDFIVEGESRTWTSIAIDRYTGRVVEQQRERVNE